MKSNPKGGTIEFKTGGRVTGFADTLHYFRQFPFYLLQIEYFGFNFVIKRF